MATDPNKKKDEELAAYEQEQAAAGKVKVDSADGSGSMWLTPDQAAAYQAKHKTSASKTQETAPAAPELNLEEKYKEAGKLLDESNTEAVNAITNSYGLQETAMGKVLEEAETLRAEQQQLDEKAQKRANAYRYITGIGDAISGIANLVGTAHGAANQEQHYNAPAVIQKAEASRKERKLEMDKLNERLRELKAQKDALAATKEMKLGEQRAKYAAEKAALELQKAEDELGLAKTAISAASRENVANIKGQYQVATQEAKGDQTTPKKQNRVPVINADGEKGEFDITNYKDFAKSYRKALNAAIKAGTSGLSEEELTEYATADKLSKTGENAAMENFLANHIYRQEVINEMLLKPYFYGLK